MAALFNNLAGLLFDKDGNLIIADYTNQRLRRMTPGGVVTTLAGSGGSGNRDGYGTLAQIDSPGNMVFDKDGNLYLTSGSNYPDYCIKKVSPSGLVTTLAGLGSGTADGTGRYASFVRAEGIVYDSEGALYITDRFNNRIRKLQSWGCTKSSPFFRLSTLG